MGEANRIIEDFPEAKYGPLCLLLFIAEIGVVFWLGFEDLGLRFPDND